MSSARWSSADLTRATNTEIKRREASPRAPQPLPAPVAPLAPVVPVVVAVMAFEYQSATGLHEQQFPNRFRIVVTGPKAEQAAVEAALDHLRRQPV